MRGFLTCYVQFPSQKLSPSGVVCADGRNHDSDRMRQRTKLAINVRIIQLGFFEFLFLVLTLHNIEWMMEFLHSHPNVFATLKLQLHGTVALEAHQVVFAR